MDIAELVLTRRTVHNYTTEKLPDSIIEEALKLSLWAPNHRLTFPWVYTLVEGDARSRLADLYVDLKGGKSGEPVTPVKREAWRKSIVNPSHVISLGLRRSGDAEQMHEDYATLAAGIQIMSLWLWHKGIATKWSTGKWSVHDKTYGILDLDPAQVKLEGVLFIGRAESFPPIPERPELHEVLRRI